MLCLPVAWLNGSWHTQTNHLSISPSLLLSISLISPSLYLSFSHLISSLSLLSSLSHLISIYLSISSLSLSNSQTNYLSNSPLTKVLNVLRKKTSVKPFFLNIDLIISYILNLSTYLYSLSSICLYYFQYPLTKVLNVLPAKSGIKSNLTKNHQLQAVLLYLRAF